MERVKVVGQEGIREALIEVYGWQIEKRKARAGKKNQVGEGRELYKVAVEASLRGS